MPASFSSTDFNYDQLIASETVSRGGTMTSGQGIVKRGTIVGVASATGKYTKTDAPTGILAEDCDATSADASCVVYVEGKFLVSGIIWPATGSHASITEALHLRSIHILSVELESGLLQKPDTTAVGLAVMPAVREDPGWEDHLQTDPAQPKLSAIQKATAAEVAEAQPGRRRPVDAETARRGYTPLKPGEEPDGAGADGTSASTTGADASKPTGTATVSLDPPLDETVPKAGASDTINVTSLGDTPWTAETNDSWITVTPTEPQTGDGTVDYVVDENPTDESRNGTITIGDQSFEITQLGA
jgi:hypothetical protein